MYLKIIHSAEHLAALKPFWQKLDENACNKSVFLSYEWINCWINTFGTDISALAIITVWDSDTLISVFPLYRRRGDDKGVFWFLGSGEPECAEVCSEGLDILVLSSLSGNLVDLLKKGLRSINLTKLNVSNCFENSFISSFCKRAGFYSTKRFVGNRYYIFSKNAETKLEKRNARYAKVSQKLNICYEILDSVDNVERFFDNLKTLHDIRWKQKQPTTIFENQQFCLFHLMLLKILVASKKASIVLLKKDEKPIAINYSIISGRDLIFYQSGVDTAFRPNISPGMLLHCFQLQYARDQGLDKYDFLRSMPPTYKENISDACESVHSFVFYRSALKLLADVFSDLKFQIRNRLYRKVFGDSFAR